MPKTVTVALRKESVDRNDPPIKPAEIGPKSLSARRAWIEIALPSLAGYLLGVALRKESVDRNPGFAKYAYGRISRSPQGERG